VAHWSETIPEGQVVRLAFLFASLDGKTSAIMVGMRVCEDPECGVLAWPRTRTPRCPLS
jgi:hypothetical protein